MGQNILNVSQKMNLNRLENESRVWFAILTQKVIVVMLQGERRLFSQHRIRYIFGQTKRRSVGCVRCSLKLLLVQEKQDDMPQHLVSCTGQLS